MDRRTFLSWVGVGWVASSLPLAIAACSPTEKETSMKDSQKSPPDGTRSDGFRSIGTVAELDKAGKLVTDTAIVVRNPTVKDAVLAVNPTCTHKGCKVNWEDDGRYFEGPCHKSKFSTTGAVVRGPAKLPLAVYEAKVENGSILVKEKVG